MLLQHCFAASIRETLDQLPESLDETYARALSQIPQVNQAHAHRMLQCLVVAVRPLRVEELAELLAFKFGTSRGEVPKYQVDWRPNDQVLAVLSTCSSLIAIVDNHGSRVVQFSHFSVKEFLMSDRLTSSLGDFSRYQILPGPAHTILAQACLGFLLHLDDHVDRESVKDFPLAEYSFEHWVTHAQFEDVASCIKEGIESLFDSDKPHFAVWVRIYNIDGKTHQVDPKKKEKTDQDSPLMTATPLYYSSLCGFCDTTEHVAIKHPEHVNAIGGRYVFPLSAALARKHVRVAEILLKHGANIDNRTTKEQTLLHEAIEDFDLVQFLVNHGADVDCQQDDLRTPLHLAAYHGELKVARLLVGHKANVDSRDNEGMTPLHLLFEASVRNDDRILDLARLLLEHGADVDGCDERNNTPLHLVMDGWMYHRARILLEHGAAANVENNDGQTPLHLLFENNHHEDADVIGLARLLMEHGADVNVRTTDEWTLLHEAAFRRWPEIARLMLDHGANMNAENERGETPLHVVSQSEHDSQEHGIGIARMLLERGMDVNAPDNDHGTPLHSASYFGRPEIAQVLLDHGAIADAENSQGETALHVVTRGKYPSQEDGVTIVWLLLDRGVDINARDKGYDTPLHSASQFGGLEIARVLLDYGASPNAENDQGETPLHLVARDGSRDSQEYSVEIVQLLLKCGAHINALDNNHNSPLHSASYFGRPEIAQALLDHGANAEAENNHGETPLHLISRSKYTSQEDGVRIAWLLLKHKINVQARNMNYDTALHLAAFKGRIEIAKVLLHHGADVNAENQQRETPLHLVTGKYGTPEGDGVCIAQLLLERGADVNRQRKNKSTPLHSAAIEGRPAILRVLLDHCANVNMANERGETPLHLVSRGKYKDPESSVRVLRLLLGHGADVNAREKNKSTPLHLAVFMGRHEITQALLDHEANTNLRNEQGETPLHVLSRGKYASQENGIIIARVLLEHGSDVNATDKDRNTPLHFASYLGRLESHAYCLTMEQKPVQRTTEDRTLYISSHKLATCFKRMVSASPSYYWSTARI